MSLQISAIVQIITVNLTFMLIHLKWILLRKKYYFLLDNFDFITLSVHHVTYMILATCIGAWKFLWFVKGTKYVLIGGA